MADTLLTLVMPDDVVQLVEDLLLAHPALVPGFTTSLADGHGEVVELTHARELVAGHAPRHMLRAVGSQADMRAVLALIKSALPHANVFYWLTPILEAGHL